MKLLLTGLPGTGKTTLLTSMLPTDCFYVVSEEIRDEAGNRVGFKVKTSTGLSEVFAHKTSVDSDQAVGDYRVDIGAIDRLFSQPIAKAEQGMVVIDEIGRMQMLSPNFKTTIDELLDKNLDILATIRHGDDWARQYTDRRDVITFTLTAENHDEIAECLKAALGSKDVFNRLSEEQQATAIGLAKRYLTNSNYVSFKKLFNNAVHYAHEDKVKKLDDSNFEVPGNHGLHKVSKAGDTWTCDCPLAKEQIECSHIESALLSK